MRNYQRSYDRTDQEKSWFFILTHHLLLKPKTHLDFFFEGRILYQKTQTELSGLKLYAYLQGVSYSGDAADGEHVKCSLFLNQLGFLHPFESGEVAVREAVTE